MTKQEISSLLKNKHESLFNWLDNQSIDRWEKGPENKWTTGQQVLHLLQSAKQLNKALGIPKLILKYKFGKSNRIPRDYEAIVNRYNERLKAAKGRTFGPSQNMRIPNKIEKVNLIKQLQLEHERLQSHLTKWKDNKLNSLLLPHPLMGKMPVREIIMWSAYHVEHHTKALQSDY